MHHFRLLLLFPMLLSSACTGSNTEKTKTEQPLAVTQDSANFPHTEYSKLPDIHQQTAITIPIGSRPYITVMGINLQISNATVQAPAQVAFRAKGLSAVGAVVAGRLTRVNVQVGDRVKAGMPMATLESPEVAQTRSDTIRARAELERAQDRAKRQAVMQRSGVGLEIERAEADVQLRQARADYERGVQAVRLLGDGVGQTVILRAPRDGVVLGVKASVGAAVDKGAVLLELGEPDALWVAADVFDNDLPLIEKGAKATVRINALPNAVAGHVVAVSADMQADLRRGVVYIELDDTPLAFKPGMFASAAIAAAGPRRIVLPTTAVLIKDKNQTVVYVEMANGEFEPRKVLIGQAREGQVPILDGLADGERVVTSDALLLDSAAAMLL
ncbi:efflux RND transporter periplasmic adaptor subunit [Methylovulum psychrotolerans]|uniref:Efflux RND transporter periplasmic adaptor subunit n=2 Tax=Methylovulum psychrotolerans TaxID=1704499 RepID=A0A2S5CKH8_9GAMM|nr:efflux RND transporter periplasmic adaptor subunit [Methylovulum psychrotolerans]